MQHNIIIPGAEKQTERKTKRYDNPNKLPAIIEAQNAAFNVLEFVFTYEQNRNNKITPYNFLKWIGFSSQDKSVGLFEIRNGKCPISTHLKETLQRFILNDQSLKSELENKLKDDWNLFCKTIKINKLELCKNKTNYDINTDLSIEEQKADAIIRPIVKLLTSDRDHSPNKLDIKLSKGAKGITKRMSAYTQQKMMSGRPVLFSKQKLERLLEIIEEERWNIPTSAYFEHYQKLQQFIESLKTKKRSLSTDELSVAETMEKQQTGDVTSSKRFRAMDMSEESSGSSTKEESAPLDVSKDGINSTAENTVPAFDQPITTTRSLLEIGKDIVQIIQVDDQRHRTNQTETDVRTLTNSLVARFFQFNPNKPYQSSATTGVFFQPQPVSENNSKAVEEINTTTRFLTKQT